ncbi:MAG: methyltransferase [Pseudomonadota bacterium]
MKMGLKGQTIVEKMVLSTGMLPEKAFMPFFSTIVTNAVLTAQRFGLFDTLSDTSLTAEEVSQLAETDPHATQVLLEALTAFGYLTRQNGRFTLERSFKKSLNGKMGESAQSVMAFVPDIARNFERLDEAVKTGKVDNFHFKPSTDTTWQNYLNFLIAGAEESVNSLIKNVPLPGNPQRMLDIAGGPAQYSIGFCKHYPSLSATILDLPESAAFGKEQIEKAGLRDRIDYVEGDFFKSDWGEGYDFALMSNILHALKEEDCQALIARAYEALKPGGIVMTKDVDYPDEDSPIDYLAGASSLLYFAMTGARTHPTNSIADWLRAAGFKDVSVRKSKTAAEIIGTKPG